MKWIDSSDIKNWADKEIRKCSDSMPLMIRSLVNETGSDSIMNKLFPAGDAVHYEGPDGIVESTKEIEYIPNGKSIWEIGIKKNIRDKAEEGFRKNTDNPIGFETINSTFIFITPRIWNYKHKEAWIKDKKQEEKWKDIKVYDARDLEEWLEKAPVTAAKFAKKILKKYPEGVQPAEDFLEEFLINPKIHLNESLILAGRDKEKEKAIKWLNSNPNRFIIKSLTKEEALAFLCACISKLEKEEKEKYFSKCLIVKNIEGFRDIANEHKEHILINYFDNFDLVDLAVDKKHHVFIPIGPDITIIDPNVELQVLNREGLKNELKDIGFTDDDSEYYSRESGRSLSVLRRILLGKIKQPDWSKQKNIKDMIPLLLAGRWDESKRWDEKFKKQLDSEDKNIIAMLANMSYEDYIENLIIYKNSDDPPVYQIGNKWRLVSPIDAWLALNRFLTSSHLEKYEKIFYEVIGEMDPEFELAEDDRFKASMFGEVRKYSEWLREGMLQTLILTSIYGNNKQNWVDRIVNNLLRNADSKKWFTLANMLPQIAEASPDTFLDNIEYSLNSKDKSILVLFREGNDVLFSRCNHAGLLWALEGLAWFPEYLPRVTLILGKLSELDPGGKWANRPIKTLRSIFLAWLPYTTANLKQRLDALDLLVKEDKNKKSDIENNVSFKLLLDLLPKPHDIGHPIYKPRWRGFSKLKVENLTNGEIYKTYSEILKRLLNIAGDNGIMLSKIFPSYDDFGNPIDREKIYDHINRAIDTMTIGKKEMWDSLREMISRHKTFQDAKWAMPIEIIDKLEVLYRKIKIDDSELSYNWLFDDYFPNIMEGNRKNHEEFEKLVEKERIKAINEIYVKNGINGILELSEKVKFPHLLGESIAKSGILKEDEEYFLMDLFDKNENFFNLLRGYTFNKMRSDGEKWIDKIINYFRNNNSGKNIIINFLISLEHSELNWKIVESFNKEIITGYWHKCNGLFGDKYTEEMKLYYYNKMIENKRFITAIDTASMYPKNIKSEIIVELLEKAVTIQSNEPYKSQLDPYHITELFIILDERNDFEDEIRLYRLEWNYIEILADNIFKSSKSKKSSPKLIYKDLSENPKSFISLIKFFAKPKDDEEMMKKEIKGKSEEQIKNLANKAWRILNTFNILPGTDENGKINYNKLIKWVKEVIKLGITFKRAYYSKYFIGKLFANAVEKDSLPPDEICMVFEEIKDKDLEQEFKIGLFNNRGLRSRGIFEGGLEENALAKHFLELSKNIEISYPRTSKVYKDISKNYEFDAKREDERATEEEMEY